MFPVSDVIPSRSRPVVTLALILLISGTFAYQVQLDDADLGAVIGNYAINAHEISVTRLITGLFLHAGWVHAAVNVLYLWLFGPNVEDAFGRTPFLLLYLGAGAISAAVQAVAHPPFAGPVIGASGAVAAVLGAYVVLYPQSRVLTLFFAVIYHDVIEIPAVAFIGVWFVLQLASDIGTLGEPVTAGPSAFWSHVVGLAIGAICGSYARWRTGVLRRYWIRGGSG